MLNFAADMCLPQLIELPKIADPRGNLSFVEDMAQLPFSIESVYWLTGVAAGDRCDGHASQSQQEMIIALSGSVSVMTDSGADIKTFLLDSPAYGLLLPAMTWRELNRFSANAVALVLSSGPCVDDDVVIAYDDFKRIIRQKS